MDPPNTIIPLIIVVLAITLFIVGLAFVIAAIAPSASLGENSRTDRPPLAKKGISRIQQISSEGQRALDELSEECLSQLWQQITSSPEAMNTRRSKQL